MKLWRWQKGRQEETEYEKFPLWYFRIGRWGFDAYILRYAPDTILPWHKDPIDGVHWRKNIKLRGYATFIMMKDGEYMPYVFKNAPWFRPDENLHMLAVGGTGCLKLSFGFAKFNKK